jgi:hypothetical protein
MDIPFFKLEEGSGPLVAACIHNGHHIRPELEPYLALNDQQRLYEEAPYTGFFADLAPTRIKVFNSRFEIDLNRPPEKAIYLEPEDSWGLKVWKSPLPDSIIENSRKNYREFYQSVSKLLQNKIEQHGFVIVLDFHSYNHRKNPDCQPADQDANPDLNLGTRNLASQWIDLADAFIEDIRSGQVMGTRLDARKDIKFKGGHFPTWINSNFEGKAFALAIELKKIFMNECTATADSEFMHELRNLLNWSARRLTLKASERIKLKNPA